MKGVVTELNLSPEEIALLQEARDLGIVGRLLEEARKKKEEQAKQQAYDKALGIATKIWKQGMAEGAEAVRVEVTISVNGTQATAVYPAPKPRSKTTTANKGNHPQELVDLLKQEAQKRGVEWYGVANAIRTKWGREVYERWQANTHN